MPNASKKMGLPRNRFSAIYMDMNGHVALQATTNKMVEGGAWWCSCWWRNLWWRRNHAFSRRSSSNRMKFLNVISGVQPAWVCVAVARIHRRDHHLEPHDQEQQQQQPSCTIRIPTTRCSFMTQNELQLLWYGELVYHQQEQYFLLAYGSPETFIFSGDLLVKIHSQKRWRKIQQLVADWVIPTGCGSDNLVNTGAFYIQHCFCICIANYFC